MSTAEQFLAMVAVCAVLLAASLAYSIYLTPVDPPAAFYLPSSRAWELLVGSLLALFFPGVRHAGGPPRLGNWVAELCVFVGLLLIGAAGYLVNARTAFPGIWALLPVVGASLVVAAGPGTLLARRMLSNRVVVWIGLISYPLYLWHWPLLALMRNLIGTTPSIEVRLALLAGSVILAAVTYLLIERPIRVRLPQGKRLIGGLVAVMICVGAFSGLTMQQGGMPFRMADRMAYAQYFNDYLYDAGQHVEERQHIANNQCNFYPWDGSAPGVAPRPAISPECFTKHSDQVVMLLGDSNVADLYYGLQQVLDPRISLLMIFSSGCGVMGPRVEFLEINHCDFANYFALDQIKADPPDIIVMSSNNSYDITYIRKFSETVKGYGVGRVIVLGQRPHWKPYLFKLVIKEFWDQTPRYIAGHQDDDLLALGKAFESQLQPNEPFEYHEQRPPFVPTKAA